MKTIKGKIIFSVACVVVLALLMGLGFTYKYIHDQMRDQLMADNQIRLEQTGHMLEYISNDILNLTRAIVADDEINALIAARRYDTTAEEIAAVYSTVGKLQEYMSMREFVQSIALVYKDGTVLWDKAPYDDYFKKLMEQPWYTEGAEENRQYRFSPKHDVATLYNDEAVVSLIAMTVDPRNMREPSGEVIVNVRLKWLQALIAEEAGYFDGFCWYGPGDDILLAQGDIDAADAQRTVNGSAREGSLYVGNGYLIWNHIPSNGWTLVSFISDRSISAGLIRIPILFILVGVFCIAGIIVSADLIIRHIVSPVNELLGLMDEAGKGNLTVQARIATNDEMAVLGEGFNAMVKQLDENILLRMENERQIREQEYDLILSRMNPHFIYNTLNTVVYLSRRDGSEDSAKVAASLIVMLQDVIKISDKSVFSTLGHEIETIEHYCTIQRYRYPDKFTLTVDIPAPLRQAIIPKTLLQPLVENALLHGLFPTDRAGGIIVRAYTQTSETLVLEVADTGDGMDIKKVEQIIAEQREEHAARHVGLSSISERLWFLYGTNGRLEFESKKGKGAVVRISLPYRQ